MTFNNRQWRPLTAGESVQPGDWQATVSIGQLRSKPEDRTGQYKPILEIPTARVCPMASGWFYIRPL